MTYFFLFLFTYIFLIYLLTYFYPICIYKFLLFCFPSLFPSLFLVPILSLSARCWLMIKMKKAKKWDAKKSICSLDIEYTPPLYSSLMDYVLTLLVNQIKSSVTNQWFLINLQNFLIDLLVLTEKVDWFASCLNMKNFKHPRYKVFVFVFLKKDIPLKMHKKQKRAMTFFWIIQFGRIKIFVNS